MGEDASLEDFVGSSESKDESESETSTRDDTAGTESQTPDSDASVDTVEPAVTTYSWSPEGAACAECDEVVERRWMQDGQLVCGACKSW